MGQKRGVAEDMQGKCRRNERVALSYLLFILDGKDDMKDQEGRGHTYPATVLQNALRYTATIGSGVIHAHACGAITGVPLRNKITIVICVNVESALQYSVVLYGKILTISLAINRTREKPVVSH